MKLIEDATLRQYNKDRKRRERKAQEEQAVKDQ